VRSAYFQALSPEERQNHIRLRGSEKFAIGINQTPGKARGTINYVDQQQGRLFTYEAFEVPKQNSPRADRAEFVTPGNYRDISKLVAIPEDELILEVGRRHERPYSVARFRREFAEDMLHR
jgi:hypothetical protein